MRITLGATAGAAV